MNDKPTEQVPALQPRLHVQPNGTLTQHPLAPLDEVAADLRRRMAHSNQLLQYRIEIDAKSEAIARMHDEHERFLLSGLDEECRTILRNIAREDVRADRFVTWLTRAGMILIALVMVMLLFGGVR